ncbi:ATP-binding protein [Actinomycetospora sp. TBRC 11914]|uniref:ATP-binding protein n=1 Tax=Actinomycetospora sp. TBRC 11914 TaxID=2729387 RepID=UPI00145D0FE8|nr:ATP-binding protein [Actinomycetospora sp. TBRC 11914]NMO88551.1 ATP-binding protein [Actinomycetospora sp. TBRC 11914]
MDAVEFERISYPADAGESAHIREAVRTWLDSSKVPDDVSHGMVLAVSEAIDNVVAHAYPEGAAVTGPATIDLTMVLDESDVVVTVADHGLWTEPTSTDLEHDATGRPARHGRGIILMNTHVDEVAIRHDRDGTSVLLRARLSPEDA